MSMRCCSPRSVIYLLYNGAGEVVSPSNRLLSLCQLTPGGTASQCGKGLKLQWSGASQVCSSSSSVVQSWLCYPVGHTSVPTCHCSWISAASNPSRPEPPRKRHAATPNAACHCSRFERAQWRCQRSERPREVTTKALLQNNQALILDLICWLIWDNMD